METDPILAEIRRTRDALAETFDFDVHAMLRDVQERQAKSGRATVSFPPKPPRSVTVSTRTNDAIKG